MKIFIVRHGETDSNKAKKLMGCRIDESLNDEGIAQAHNLTKNLHEGDFDIIFTSTLKRAKQTAEIIADKIKVPIIERKEIVERDFGSLSGKGWDEMGKNETMSFREMDSNANYNYRPYGGESVEDVKNRLRKIVNEVKKDFSDKKVLVVAHGGILKLANVLFLGKKLEKTPDNASIFEFEI